MAGLGALARHVFDVMMTAVYGLVVHAGCCQMSAYKHGNFIILEVVIRSDRRVGYGIDDPSASGPASGFGLPGY